MGLLLEAASVLMQRDLDNFKSHDSDWSKDNALSSAQLRLILDLPIAERFSLFAGSGIAVSYNPNKTETITKENIRPLIIAGISLF